jgi:Uma2 family endonuclease
MVIEVKKTSIPRTLEEFLIWNQPEDGFKYEWNDGELIKFNGMNRKQVYIYDALLNLFIKKGFKTNATLVSEYDIMLTMIQIRRADVAYLTNEQIAETKLGIDVIPKFVIEILSESDNVNKVEEKVAEYFKAGVKVVWNIYFEQKVVYVYTSRKNVKICTDNDTCSASPVLDGFEISVQELLG